MEDILAISYFQVYKIVLEKKERQENVWDVLIMLVFWEFK